MSDLMLHRGSREVSEEELVAVPIPPATPTWTTIPPHGRCAPSEPVSPGPPRSHECPRPSAARLGHRPGATTPASRLPLTSQARRQAMPGSEQCRQSEM